VARDVANASFKPNNKVKKKSDFVWTGTFIMNMYEFNLPYKYPEAVQSIELEE
jgi:hypothetical protein